MPILRRGDHEGVATQCPAGRKSRPSRGVCRRDPRRVRPATAATATAATPAPRRTPGRSRPPPRATAGSDRGRGQRVREAAGRDGHDRRHRDDREHEDRDQRRSGHGDRRQRRSCDHHRCEWSLSIQQPHRRLLSADLLPALEPTLSTITRRAGRAARRGCDPACRCGATATSSARSRAVLQAVWRTARATPPGLASTRAWTGRVHRRVSDRLSTDATRRRSRSGTDRRRRRRRRAPSAPKRSRMGSPS